MKGSIVMPTAFGRRLAALFAVILLVFTSLTAYAAPRSTAPEATDGTTPSTSITVLPDTGVTTLPITTDTPTSSSMMDTPLTTTPDTTETRPDNDGFAYTGLVIALVVAGLVIALIILLVPKNKDKN